MQWSDNAVWAKCPRLSENGFKNMILEIYETSLIAIEEKSRVELDIEPLKQSEMVI